MIYFNYSACILSLFILINIYITMTKAYATDEVSFETKILYGNIKSQNLDPLIYQNTMIEGEYEMDLYVNDDEKGRFKIKFIQDIQKQGLETRVVACFNHTQILNFGIDEKKIDSKLGMGECAQLQEWLEGASYHVDIQKLELRLIIPSSYLSSDVYSIQDSQKWDAGIDALFFNYNLFYVAYLLKNNPPNNNQNNQTVHANFRTGINLSQWQLRHEAQINSHAQANQWLENLVYESNFTYLQRYIPAYRSVLKAGELWTESTLFEPIVFYGLSMNSDDRMLSSIATTYAPTLYGIAQTNARVEVRYQNQLIYQAMVAAGSFEINQLSVLGTQGELELRIIEANGEVKNIKYPYVSSPQLLRPGFDRYSLYLGQYRSKHELNQQKVDQPKFIQLEYARGLSNYLSSGGGLHYAQSYFNSHLSFTLATPIGIWTSGLEWGYRDLKYQRQQYETKLKLTYSYFIQQSQSAVQLSFGIFQQSKSELLNRLDKSRLSETLSQLENVNHLETTHQIEKNQRLEMNNRLESKPSFGLVEILPKQAHRQRLDAQLSFYQKLPQTWGNLTFAANYSQDTMFKSQRYGFNIGYQQRFKWFSYNLNLFSSLKKDALNKTVQELNYMLSMTIPLQWATRRAQLSTDLQARSHRSGIAMDVTERASLGLSLSNTAGAGEAYSLSTRIRQAEYVLNMGYATSQRDRQYALNLSGSLIAHRQGILWSAEQGSTMALVYAPNAMGAKINNALGARINRKGYALVPYLSPYRSNDISLDPSDIPNFVELEYSRLRVIPYADAILNLNFPTHLGYVLFIQAKLNDASALPFYAPIYNQNDKLIGHVAQGGLVYIRTAQLKGRIKIILDQNTQAFCELDYDVSQKKEILQVGYAMLEGLCISRQS